MAYLYFELYENGFLAKTVNQPTDLLKGLRAFEQYATYKLLAFQSEFIDRQNTVGEELPSFIFPINAAILKGMRRKESIEAKIFESHIIKDEKTYKNLKAIIQSIDLTSSETDLSLVQKYYDKLINYAFSRRKAAGRIDQKYQNELLELYIEGYNRKILFVDNQLPASHFINFIDFSINAKGVLFVEEFTKQYLQYIAEENRKLAEDFAWVYIRFYQNNFEETLNIVNKYTKIIHNIHFSIKRRIFLLKAKTELQQNEELESELIKKVQKSFEENFRNNRLGKNNKESLVNFCEILKGVIANRQAVKGIKRKRDALNDLKKIKQSMEDEKNIGYRNWLNSLLDREIAALS